MNHRDGFRCFRSPFSRSSYREENIEVFRNTGLKPSKPLAPRAIAGFRQAAAHSDTNWIHPESYFRQRKFSKAPDSKALGKAGAL
jgi:hypothetical protein